MSERGTLATGSLNLASYLLARGHAMAGEGVRRDGPGHALFVFAASASLEEDAEAFHAGHALVEPNAYTDARIALRRRMDSVLGRGARTKEMSV